MSTSSDMPPALRSHHPGEDTASGKAGARCLVLVLTWCPGIGLGHAWSPEGCGFPACPGHLAQMHSKAPVPGNGKEPEKKPPK